jgi:hypothetical protein
VVAGVGVVLLARAVDPVHPEADVPAP